MERTGAPVTTADVGTAAAVGGVAATERGVVMGAGAQVALRDNPQWSRR